MAETKFTPGRGMTNWRAESRVQDLDPSGITWIVAADAEDSEGAPMNILLADWLTEDVARLIAAAPDLFEALLECAEDLESEIRARYGSVAIEKYASEKRRFDNDMAPVIAARAALAKATGSES